MLSLVCFSLLQMMALHLHRNVWQSRHHHLWHQDQYQKSVAGSISIEPSFLKLAAYFNSASAAWSCFFFSAALLIVFCSQRPPFLALEPLAAPGAAQRSHHQLPYFVCDQIEPHPLASSNSCHLIGISFVGMKQVAPGSAACPTLRLACIWFWKTCSPASIDDGLALLWRRFGSMGLFEYGLFLNTIALLMTSYEALFASCTGKAWYSL